MIKKLDFKKEEGRWYAVVPEWEGPKDDLEMVSGADWLLEQLSHSKDNVTLVVGDEPIPGGMATYKVRDTPGPDGGADYFMPEFKHEFWLCKVLDFVMGYLPETIYFKVDTISTIQNRTPLKVRLKVANELSMIDLLCELGIDRNQLDENGGDKLRILTEAADRLAEIQLKNIEKYSQK